MIRSAALPAVLVTALLGSSALAQPVMRLPASEYGKTTLRLTESLGGAAADVALQQNVFEPVADLREDDPIYQAARAVGRLDLLIDEDGDVFTSTCTATLINGGTEVLTNYHCIPSYSGTILEASLLLDYLNADSEVTRVELDVTPTASDPELDFSIVAVTGTAPADIPDLAFRPELLQPRERLFIIHHPLGQTKVMTQFQCATARSISETTNLRHTCDTQPGSSGSPIFSLDREIVGLHHSGGLNDNDDNSFNAGTKVFDIPVLAALAAAGEPEAPTAPATVSSEAPAASDVVQDAQGVQDVINSEIAPADPASTVNDLISGN